MREGRGFIAGVLTTVLAMSLVVGAQATVGKKTMTADYNNIKIELDGQQITPTDANGKAVEPFAVDGTTYLPVRAVSEALGMDVEWDGNTSTVLLSSPNLLDPDTASYVWSMILYTNMVDAFISEVDLYVANGGGSASEIEYISSSFYDEIVPSLNDMSAESSENMIKEIFYNLCYQLTSSAEETIYCFAKHEADPNTSTKNEYMDARDAFSDAKFLVMNAAGNYYMGK